MINAVCLSRYFLTRNIIFVHSLSKCQSINTLCFAMYQSATVKLVQNTKNTTCTVALLYTILLSIWRKLAQARHMTTKFIYICHSKLCLCLLSNSKQVQHSVSTTSHCDIKSHCIEESIACGNVAWQHTIVSILIISKGILHYLAGSSLKQLDTILVCGKDGAVARQSHTNSFSQGVH